jgi:hypothetical protein
MLPSFSAHWIVFVMMEVTMSSLDVTEKEHWKGRIGKKLDGKIEAVTAADPGFIERLTNQARQRALRSLGLAEMQAELNQIATQRNDLDRRQCETQRAMLAVLWRVPVEEIDEDLGSSLHADVTRALNRRQAVHEEELLAEHALGKEILRLRREKSNLGVTVWLATSSQQLRDLWQRVVTLLGEEPTTLEKEALALGTEKAE